MKLESFLGGDLAAYLTEIMEYRSLGFGNCWAVAGYVWVNMYISDSIACPVPAGASGAAGIASRAPGRTQALSGTPSLE